LKTFLNFENSLRFENLFKPKARKNSPATGVTFILQAPPNLHPLVPGFGSQEFVGSF